MYGHQSSHADGHLSAKLCYIESVSVYLGLNKVGRYYFTTIAVKEGQGRAECWCRDAPQDSLGNDTSPARLGLVDRWMSISKMKYIN